MYFVLNPICQYTSLTVTSQTNNSTSKRKVKSDSTPAHVGTIVPVCLSYPRPCCSPLFISKGDGSPVPTCLSGDAVRLSCSFLFIR